MSSRLNPLAGQPAPAAVLVDIPKLITAYYSERPDPQVPAQRVAFGTSGHRGSSLEIGFNEAHVLSISQAICEYRKLQNIDGPLFMGFDTHALSAPAFASAMEVLAANGVDTMIAPNDEYTPTPAVSLAILNFNRGRSGGLADGIVITPSHNPPDSGGFKYNPPNGGPADTDATRWIETRANELLQSQAGGVKRMALNLARRAPTTHLHDYLQNYVRDLGNVLDMDVISKSRIRMGVDPLGGAGVHYWPRIAEQYRLDLDVVNDAIDPTFRFMTLDWDGKIRMDPSSPYAMKRLIGLKDRYDIAFACDTDHDRHGIVAASSGLMAPNQYLSVAIDYLFRQRTGWRADAVVGKTVVSSAMIDRVARRLKRTVYEVPVGFKWFVAGLLDSSLSFGGEESAGASFSRIDGGAWTTDKDGIAPALLAAEITARTGRDPGEHYRALTQDLGACLTDRVDAAANAAQKLKLGRLDQQQVRITQLAGEPIDRILTRAPGNNAPIGGVKVTSSGGWFAARPSGTEDIYKIYAESFHDDAHLRRLLAEAQTIVDTALAAA
ncbi:MAG TPA: phosphoglucomutase (alpha-D-glucose-1,6-bisphosphate-dependent) [Steroidobacteraceae bacterium]|nr:phosphoglucomutase (alpha-D-glucose-1,6-bisphosphate-dependent) [Steroidobacteraceae bacterium]